MDNTQNNQSVRWEYTCYYKSEAPGEKIRHFNELGQEGWELVTVDDNYNYFFKRRLP